MRQREIKLIQYRWAALGTEPGNIAYPVGWMYVTAVIMLIQLKFKQPTVTKLDENCYIGQLASQYF